MKKLLCVFLCLIFAFSCLTCFAYGQEGEQQFNFNLKTRDITIRDPSVLAFDGLYYMYGTGAATTAGYGCYVSPDLENWAGPFNVFEASKAQDFDGAGDYWAPECHYYQGSFYLFATYKSGTTGFRGTSVFKSESPLGPFVEISDGHITPHDTDNIDGTLYIDENGQPWMVYVCEWTTRFMGEGEMAVAKMSSDLSHFISTPKVLFHARNSAWSSGGVTDGPWLYKTSEGKLLMIWSSVTDQGYSIGITESKNGKVNGEWKQHFSRLYSGVLFSKDHTLTEGGHGTIFKTFDGRLMMSLHSPNFSDWDKGIHETAVFVELEDTGSTIRVKGISPERRLAEIFATFIQMLDNWGYNIEYSIRKYLGVEP